MSREDEGTVAEVEDLNTEVDELDEGEAEPKKEAAPKRGNLPEGYVTPIGLAKELTERGMHQNREGKIVEVRPQMVYSYMKNASKDDPFPIVQVEDSNGTQRRAVLQEEGLAWWQRKNERVAERKKNAAEKEAKKKANAEKKAQAEAEGDQAVEAESGSEEVVEAE